MGYQQISCLDLRVGIARAMNMPFQSLFTSGQSTITVGSNTYLDPKLTQPQDYWKNQWLFIPDIPHIARITGSQNGVLQVDNFISFSGGKQYEIFSIFTPADILWAINQSIVSSYPFYYDKFDYLNFSFGISKYPLGALGVNPARIKFVFQEIPETSSTYQADTIAYNAGVITLTGNFQNPPKAGYVICIAPNDLYSLPYCGIISSASTTQIQFSIPTGLYSYLSLTPDALVRTYNPMRAVLHPYPYVAVNREEFPDELYIENFETRAFRMKITYTTIPQEIEYNGTTIVPSGYIIPKAVSLLSASKITDTRIDTRRWQALIEVYSRQAEEFKMRYPFREGSTDLWAYPPLSTSFQHNPLEW